jgi:GNAT superfamily N-acetyltransferase
LQAAAVLTIRALTPTDAAELSAWLCSQPTGHLQYFTPFAFDRDTLERLIAACRRDYWIGVWGPRGLVGFFMLRGFDEGYETPAYGVAVDAAARGLGIGRLTLVASKTLCRLIGVARIMLKVHPENGIARRLYESEGFVQTGVDPATAALIYHFDLMASADSRG